MSYKVSSGAIGRRKVTFDCKCGEVITTTLESASQQINCPTCGLKLTIPGQVELDAQNAMIAAQAAAKLARNQKPAPPIAGLNALAATAPMPIPTPTLPAAVSYATPATSRSVPTYAGLTVASRVLHGYAMFLYALGVLGVGLAVVAFSLAFFVRDDQTRTIANTFALGAIGPGLVGLFAAAMAHGTSAALTALRDIAMNSFR